MKKILWAMCVSIVVVGLSSNSFAETIYLKTGKKIRGQILEKNDQQMKVDISGVKVTYFVDEIDHIEESAPADQPPPMVKAEPVPAQPVVSVGQEMEFPNTEMSSPVEVTSPEDMKAPSMSPPPPAGDMAQKNLENTLPAVSATPMDSPTHVSSPSSLSEQKKALIIELIDASGTKETMTQMFDQIKEQAPADQVEILKKVLDINEIISRLIPIYDKYFSDAELQELIAFYKGTTGQKLIEVMPLIMEDSMNASETYFKEKMPSPEVKSEGSFPLFEQKQ